ncbi:MAG: DUF1572 family protein [Saprospiraceae bacterium]
MIIDALIPLFERNLNRLENEISQYKSEASLWKMEKEIPNSAGNLALHLCGNLQHFIGAILGNTGYVRQRDDEFSLKDVPGEELIQQIQTTKKVVSETLKNLDETVLENDYPIEVMGGKQFSTIFFLIHLSGHLEYHLGQVNYHRRLLDF